MTIDALSSASLATQPFNTVDPVATPTDVEAFTRTLFGHLDKLPDEQAIEQFQAKAADINTRIDETRGTEEVLQSPLHVLAAQTRALNAIAEVDLIAKAAGGISQGINKLTSMQ
ncbi:type III secretion system inner rod subunit SctI [Pseudomonas chlororaphis]|uniref:type III secretion system inner rod subunit SctI n=1 Tax=Pseudomonas chlororaphis TaxID=587753 RepID=UPI0015DDF05F|nr:type III secretion system inner rod subunit SctI [Pseudomonas chlororaphis]QLL13460.1 type III secretion system inner rod subunit SctI [Pseudomonas chlororaphis subsp. aurantiaca]